VAPLYQVLDAHINAFYDGKRSDSLVRRNIHAICAPGCRAPAVYVKFL